MFSVLACLGVRIACHKLITLSRADMTLRTPRVAAKILWANCCGSTNTVQRRTALLNTDWLFLAEDQPAAAGQDFDESSLTPVCLPHSNAELPYHGFDEREYAFVSWYRRRLKLPAEAANGRVFLDFDGVMIAATVFVNGQQVGPEHRGGYTPFSVDITECVKVAADNQIAVRVDSTERPDIPPFGHVVDYMTFGGLYRDVHLRLTDRIYIEDVFARPTGALADQKQIDAAIRVANTTNAPQTVQIAGRLSGPDCDRTDDPVTVNLPANTVTEVELCMPAISGVQKWTLDDPRLYRFEVQLDNGDCFERRVGFREAEFRADGTFHLNGEQLSLRGLNRHQTYPYLGAAAPAKLQRRDAEIIKRDLACNIVRTSHYPQSPHFLDACDELGLLVFEEIPGWQHLGDEAWKKLVVRDVRGMIIRDRHHPSIILWGVRVNESLDEHELYTRTNALAHDLDPTRQTAGVRCLHESERLEDVFTFNDFNYTLFTPNHPRYLITEFTGHMFPTKSFDQEERVREHTWRHMHAHNQILAPDFACAGGIAWCAFDYNTHKDFGSGDRICYHGVMDIFREPKLAAHFYAAHADPRVKPIVEPITYWSMGDKSGAGVEPLLIATNCDEVELRIGEMSCGRFKPDRDTFPNLPYPPVVATSLGADWGAKWHALTLLGYLNGEHVVTKQIDNDGIPQRLHAMLDHDQLLADGSDTTRLSLRILDRYDNILPFQMQPVTLELEGPAILVGDNPHPMPGGRGAVFVRATREVGQVTITARTARLAPQTVTLQIIEPAPSDLSV